MRGKKQVRKSTTCDQEVQDQYAKKNAKKGIKEKAQALTNDELFAVNIDKDGLKKKRDKLRADRFKQKATIGNMNSKVEVTLMKRLAKKGPPEPQKRSKKDGDEMGDIWGSAPEVSKNIQRFKDFTNKTRINVKGVILPQGGQSFNPSATEHHKTLKQVIKEEEDQIEKEYKESMQYRIDRARQYDAAMNQIVDKDQEDDDNEASNGSDSDSQEDDSSEDSSMVEHTNKPVDRLKKKTKQQRNKKEKGLAKVLEQQQAKKERLHQRQYDKIDAYIQLDAKETQITNQKIEARQKREADERKKQEQTGIVDKAQKVGKVPYKMQKTDFQLEDELAGSLRQLKAQGHDDLLRDRFDTVFRKNLIELEDPELMKKRRRDMKKIYKFKQRQGGVYGSVVEKLHKKNQKKAKEIKEKQNKEGFLQDDLIFI